MFLTQMERSALTKRLCNFRRQWPAGEYELHADKMEEVDKLLKAIQVSWSYNPSLRPNSFILQKDASYYY